MSCGNDRYLVGSDNADWKTKAKEAMKLWNERYSLWKTFDISQQKYLKSYVGLMSFGKPEMDETTNSEVNIEIMYLKYDEKKRKVIDNIVSKFKFENGKLCLAHTLLYLSNDWQICVFRQMKLNGDINFIDFNGRVYASWQDFVETNKFPKCEYISPVNGIHDITNDRVELHQSPASSKLGAVCDFMALGATVASLALIGISMAPVTATVLGAGGAAYGVGNSFHSLWDRATHKQSIAPTNMESVGCYVAIGTAGLCGVSSSLNLLKSTRFVEQSGKLSSMVTTAIKGANYAAATSTFTTFGFHLYVLQHKLRNGEASYSDLFDLCIDVFLIYGAVCNVREMRSCVSNLEANPTTPPKGLSKGARRRWRKRQAKSSTVSTGNQNVTNVGAWDAEIFHYGVGTTGILFRKLLHQHCPAVYEIYDSVCIIIGNFRDFILRKTSAEAFYANLITHGHNLFKLLQNNSSEIKEIVMDFLRRCGIVVSSRSVQDISNIIDDGVIAINNVVSDESLPEEEHERDSDLELNSSQDGIAYKMILQLVKDRICRREISTTEQLLSAFTLEIISTADEVKLKITREYETMLSNNVEVMGEEKAKMILSRIGINSKYDFANQIIEKTIESMKIDTQTNISNNLEKQLDQLFSLYEQLFTTLADENEISSIKALESCDILNNSIELVIQPLTTLYRRSKKIYDLNEKYFGTKDTMTLVVEAMSWNNSTINYENCTDSTLLGLAIKNVDFSESKSRLLSPVETIDKPSTDEINFTDDFKIETLLLICDFYVQRVDCIEKNITKLYSFVIDKFIDHFQLLTSQQTSTVDVKEKLKLNITFLGKNNFIQLNKFLRDTNSLGIFNQVVEIFWKEDFALELIAEYHKTIENVEEYHGELLKHLVADDGVTLYKITLQNRQNVEEYKQLAVKLFGVSKYRLEVIKKAENLVLLRNSNDSHIVFQFVKNEPEALVMQFDSKKIQEN